MAIEDSRVHKLMTDSSKAYRNAPPREQIVMFAQIVIMLFALPILLIALVWLTFQTDLLVVQNETPDLLILLILLLLFTRSRFRFQMSVVSGGAISLTGSFDFVIVWSAALVFGPTALWLFVISSVIVYLYTRRLEANQSARTQLASETIHELASGLLASLIGLFVFSLLGGVHPYGPLTIVALIPALVATLVAGLLPTYIMFPVPLLATRYMSRLFDQSALPMPDVKDLARTSAVGSGLSATMAIFSLFGALIYTNVSFAMYLFFAGGVLFAGLLANQLTRSIERAEQRSRELAVLEELGRALGTAPPGDDDALREVLAQYAPRMVPGGLVEAWFAPDKQLLPIDGTRLPDSERVRLLLATGGESHFFVDNIVVTETTGGVTTHDGLAVVLKNDSAEKIGGVYVLVRRDRGKIASFLPAVQSLAAQIEATVARAAAHKQALANARMQNELNVAARIQTSFLPDSVPQVVSWDIAATLIPARQCSGDFYDFIALDDGRLGIIVADVADKGTGAALYMALSRTVMRTFAMQGDHHPAHVIKQANDRILQDTSSNQFVTTFYGILDPATGEMTYCNAGHNPTFILRAADGSVETLGETGIPVGMVDDLDWDEGRAQIMPGDIMLLYTDGVPEAQDAAEDLYEERRLLAVANDFGRNAQYIQEAIINSIQAFVGDAPQFDDITLVVVKRDALVGAVG